jgi:hypothetical protein
VEFIHKKFRNRTPKTALFINSQAEQFSNVRKKKELFTWTVQPDPQITEKDCNRALPEVLDISAV